MPRFHQNFSMHVHIDLHTLARCSGAAQRPETRRWAACRNKQPTRLALISDRETFFHHCSEVVRQLLCLLLVSGFDHDAHDGFGARGAKQHAAVARQHELCLRNCLLQQQLTTPSDAFQDNYRPLAAELAQAWERGLDAITHLS